MFGLDLVSDGTDKVSTRIYTGRITSLRTVYKIQAETTA